MVLELGVASLRRAGSGISAGNAGQMITSVHLLNFKGHRDTTLSLGRLMVLVGPNGAGKTSVLQALALLLSLSATEPAKAFRRFPPHDVLRRGSRGPFRLAATGEDGGTPWSFMVEVKIPDTATHDERKWDATVSWTHGNVSRHIEGRDSFPETFEPLVRKSERATLYRFNAHQIAAVAVSEDERPRIKPDGVNTAAVLAALKLEDEETFDQIEDELRRIIPSVERIRIRREKTRAGAMGHKIVLDLRGAPGIPAEGASEGTLVTLALITVLCSPDRPHLLMLDDLHHALHPEAQLELVRQLKQLLVRFPEVQIVATTHSPYILEELDPSQILVFAHHQDGYAAVKPLSAHPQAAQMAGALTAGQLWSLDPERRWVLEEG